MYGNNHDLQTTDEDIRAFFSDVGGVAAIRILRDKFTGKSRVSPSSHAKYC